MQTLYHGTAEKNVPGILVHGLIPQGGRGADSYAIEALGWNEAGVHKRAPSVFLTPDVKIAAWYAKMTAHQNHSTPAIIKVALPEKLSGALVEDERGEDDAANKWGFRYPGTIPPALLQGEIPPEALAVIEDEAQPIPTSDPFSRFIASLRG